MFGRKARELKALKEIHRLEVERSRDFFKVQGREIQELKEKIVGLTADRDAARLAVDAAESLRDGERIKCASALADRDQFAKRVEELQEQIKELDRKLEARAEESLTNSHDVDSKESHSF